MKRQSQIASCAPLHTLPSRNYRAHSSRSFQNYRGLASVAMVFYTWKMSTRKVSFVPGEFFHVYNRGNNKQLIYQDTKDYERFVDLLYAVNRQKSFSYSNSQRGVSIYEMPKVDPLVSIGAYCLMPNHFHIVVTPTVENGLSIFMQKLSTAYAMYYNEKYKRTGSLFEGKFKAEHTGNDRYLKYLFSYCHLNPLTLIKQNTRLKPYLVKKSDMAYLSTYPYSSFLDYMEVKRKQNAILNRDNFPLYFPNKSSFISEIKSWISYRTDLNYAKKSQCPKNKIRLG